jgi:transcription initiation factor TFIID subunit 3
MKIISRVVKVNDGGGEMWICPCCNKPDDSNPMIGCDSCDDWYHW